MRRIKEKLPVLFLLAFFPISILRFFNAISRAWNSTLGELLANFPFAHALKYYNPSLLASIRELPAGGPFLAHTSFWFYGPVHHLWLFPLTYFVHSAPLFFRIVLVFYICLIIGMLFFLGKSLMKNKDYLFLAACFTVALGSFQLLDNFGQRNVELLEFALIIGAYLCMRKRYDFSAGALLCLASMAKVLPIIFFPYLLIKKRFRAIAGFLVTFAIVFMITEITLGWKNYYLFNLPVMSKFGMPTIGSLLGDRHFTDVGISPVRGSFYTFILTFFANINMSKSVPAITYKIDNFLAPNLIYLILAILIFIISFYLFYKTGRKGNLLYEFSIVGSMVYLLSPHCNPHYYIFTIFAFISILRFCSYDLQIYRLPLYSQIVIFFIFILSLLLMGNLIPLTIYEKILPLENMAFHYFSTYSIFGLGTFILWLFLLYIYRVDYKTITIRE